MAKAKTITRNAPLSGATVSPIRSPADGTTGQAKKWPPKGFDGFDFSPSPIYTLDPTVNPFNVHDQLNARLTQLTSMTTMLTGEGADVFHGWNDDIQDGYLWAIATMVKECEELAALLPIHAKENSNG
jgi:hypothetical protein